ncbi:MAG: hypothetical protein M1401_19855 [Chloroflexi bacterium]|nr:hypothetical protein [Chloroflexota bacterium]
MSRSRFTALIVGAVLVAGCSSPAAAPATTAPAAGATTAPAAAATTRPAGGAVNAPGTQPGQGVTITGQDGAQVTINSGLPEELKAFPVPTGFAYDSGGSMSSQGKDGGSLNVATYKGQASLADSMNFYKQTAASKGWTEGMSFSDNKGGQLWYTTPDQYSYIVTFSLRDDGSTEISVLGGKDKATAVPTKTAAATQAPARATATTTPAKPAATPTPSGPALTSNSALPQELRDLPMPSGFAVEKDGVLRMASGGKFQMAAATLFGQGDPATIGAWYQQNLKTKGWQESFSQSAEDEMTMMFTQTKDGVDLTMALNISKRDDGTGTEVFISVTVT